MGRLLSPFLANFEYAKQPGTGTIKNMIEMIEAKLNLKVDVNIKHEYKYCISDLAQNKIIRSLRDFVHHRNFSRLEHCIHVSYLSLPGLQKIGP